MNSLINYKKKILSCDSCKKKLHSAFTGQSTHKDLVKKSGLRHIFLISLACGAFYFIKNLACGACFSQEIFFLIIRGCISFEVFYFVYQYISGENDSNSNTESSQRHNLDQTVITKVSNNKPFVKSNLLRYK